MFSPVPSTDPLVPGLYVVATPIGNLGDISPRGLSVLAQASVVAAEDTRVSRKLLTLAGSAARMISLNEHNVVERSTALLEAAREGVVALVSDAGTPAISDPGARLVEAAHAAGVPVFGVPGPSALATALSVAGFGETPVAFLGFLPRPAGERASALQSAAVGARVLVFFESPGRLAKTLGELAALFGDPETVVCRELTKLHEEVVRGPASALAARFDGARGEVTVVVRIPPQVATDDSAGLTQYLAEMRRAGARRPAAAAEAARRFGVPRNRAYDAWDEA